MRILHVSQIDNQMSKGTSAVIPNCVLSQTKIVKDITYLNCNNIKLLKMVNYEKYYMISDNKNMNVFKNSNPDIVIFHEVYKPYYLKLYKYCINNKIPYVIIPHGCLTKQAQNNKRIKKLFGNILLFNNFIKHANSIQYLSDNEFFNSKYKNQSHYIIGNGIENIPSKNKYSICRHNNLEFNYIYVGRFDFFIKGLDKLLLACYIIKKEMIKYNIKLKLYGIGNNKNISLLNNYIKKYDLKKCVTINGPIYGIEKQNEIIKNDVFIQVSRSEGQPLGVVEALSLGVPVLVSIGTGLADEVKNKGLGLTVECDEKSIATEMLRFFEEKDKLLFYSNNAYSYAKNNYCWDAIAVKCIKKYADICGVKNDF